MITTETFTNFARRLAATKGYPDVIIAETPNPLRQLDDASLQQRAEAMLSTIIAGLTQSPEAAPAKFEAEYATSGTHKLVALDAP